MGTCRPVRILKQWRSTHSTTVGTVGAHCTYPIDSNDFVGFGGTKTVSFQPRNLRLPIANRQALQPGSVILRTEIIQTISPPATARPGIPCGPDGSDATDRVRFIRVCFTADSRLILLLPSSWPFPYAHLPPGLFIAVGLHSCLFRRVGVTSLPLCTLRHAAMFSHWFPGKGLIASNVAAITLRYLYPYALCSTLIYSTLRCPL